MHFLARFSISIPRFYPPTQGWNHGNRHWMLVRKRRDVRCISWMTGWIPGRSSCKKVCLFYPMIRRKHFMHGSKSQSTGSIRRRSGKWGGRCFELEREIHIVRFFSKSRPAEDIPELPLTVFKLSVQSSVVSVSSKPLILPRVELPASSQYFSLPEIQLLSLSVSQFPPDLSPRA